jgi:hypothetical protein
MDSAVVAAISNPNAKRGSRIRPRRVKRGFR